MHALPIDLARQLVADRHTSYETAAQRRRLRRFVLRRPAYNMPTTTAPATAPVTPTVERPVPVTVHAQPTRAPRPVAGRRVA